MKLPAIADRPLVALPALAILIAGTTAIMSTIGRHNALGDLSFWVFALSILSFCVVSARAVQRQFRGRS
jgi:hypothetical protein